MEGAEGTRRREGRSRGIEHQEKGKARKGQRIIAEQKGAEGAKNTRERIER